MPPIRRGLASLLLSPILMLNAHLSQHQAGPPHKPTASKSNVSMSDQRDLQDEKILRSVADASAQADSWTNAIIYELLNEAPEGAANTKRMLALLDQIKNDQKAESHWEESIWTIPYSELLPGESIWQHVGTFVMVEGTRSTMRQRVPKCRTAPAECGSNGSDTEKTSYVVEAPLDVKARILVERLRQAILHYSAIQQFRGKPVDDAFVIAWNTAWFDARNIYCRRSPGDKYRDLLGEEQACKQP
jgi:hypothetical protein